MAEKRGRESSLPSPPGTNAKRSREETEQDDLNCINNIRVLAVDMVEKANSGHPGAPMGCAPMAHVLFGSVMNFAPQHPKWFNRDRFVLSNGHACALLYVMLHISGYDVSMDQLKQFRQLGSITPGHPENFVTPGVEVSTGPLGQGITNAVGMAIAEKHLQGVFNRPGFESLIDHFTYVLCGDGCLQEGISSEACSLAGHLGLGKLIVLYDDNHITIDGDTSLSFTEDVNKRYESYNWQVLVVEDGNDLVALRAAITAAQADIHHPTLIKVRTTIGYGSVKAGTHGVHGAPLGPTDTQHVKTLFGFDPTQSFTLRESTQAYYKSKLTDGEELVSTWNSLFDRYKATYPELGSDLQRRIDGHLPPNFADIFPSYVLPETKTAATRNRSEDTLNALASITTELIGGSADLTSSNLTFLRCSGDFQKATPSGRYIRFGVREHAMIGICNGIFAHGALRPYCATFLNFLGYAFGSLRVAALSRFGIIMIMTHDSIGLGEDGPTHQPVEMLFSLRAMPNLLTIRPADGNEVNGAYKIAMEFVHTPTVISLSRQAAPTIAGTNLQSVALGAYVITEFGTAGGRVPQQQYPTIILVGTGTELIIALNTAKLLHSQYPTYYIRVVSMPCTELFDMQSMDYQLSIFTPGSPVMSIEAGGVEGWKKYAHAPFGLTSFGLSAPASDLYKHFGFTPENLVVRAQEVIVFYGGGVNGSHPMAPSLLQYPRFPIPTDVHAVGTAGNGHHR